MQRTVALLGGGRRYLYPKDVWSPAGGWWNNEPPNWQRNTGIAVLAVAAAAYTIFQFSAARERRPNPPVNFIPSQLWSAHAAEDDPRLRPVVDEFADTLGTQPIPRR